MMIKTIAICFSLGLFFNVRGQEEIKQKKEDFNYRHTITVSGGRASRLNQEGDYTPKSVGADYLRRLTTKWEVGAQFDLNFSDKNNEPDLFLAVGIVAFSINNKWPIFGGFGIEDELDGKGTILLGRFGTEYSLFLDKNEHFAILPGAFIDFTKHGASPSLVLAFGYFFGQF